jgi:biotin synthase
MISPTAAKTPAVEKWTLEAVRELFERPLLDLVFDAARVYRDHHDEQRVQLCTLLSVKTGACPEDCGYCPQSAHHDDSVEPKKLMDAREVLERAREARDAGSTRFCMGAAWREVKDGQDFDRVIEMVRGVRALGLEACCTLGMITEEQARRLKEAGLTAYNHNLDSSEEFYGKIISTRSYEDRLRTLQNVARAGISACCGGIIGMGESVEDRVALLHTLANLESPPESVPVNALVAAPGTPLEGRPPVDAFEFVRMIAAARILFPHAKVRLSAGRLSLSPESQALCFLAGANSIFTGEKLLTTPNPSWEADRALLKTLGLKPLKPEEHALEA